MKEKKVRKRRRTKKEIEQAFNDEAIKLISAGGFSNLTVSNIIKNCEMEPAVFYNRYQDMAEFIDKFVRKSDFGLMDEGIPKSESIDRKGYADMIKNMFLSLKDNKVMQQLLRWELFEENDTTLHTAKLRESYTLPLVDKYIDSFKNAPYKIEVMSAIIIGGVYYLLLHARLSPFARVDVNTKEGEKQIIQAVEYLTDLLFENVTPYNQKIKDAAKKMKADGMDNKLISKYTDIPVEFLEKM